MSKMRQGKKRILVDKINKFIRDFLDLFYNIRGIDFKECKNNLVLIKKNLSTSTYKNYVTVAKL